MRDDELKTIVDAVVQVLAERGVIKRNPSAPRVQAGGKTLFPAEGTQSPSVTVGTAGKVFSSPLVNAQFKSCRPSGVRKCNQEQPGEDCGCSPGCQRCNPLGSLTPGELRDVGVDRIGICNPTEKCSTIAGMIDHTLLKPNATQEEIGRLCEEARKFCFASVCVNPAYVPLSARLLKGSGVRVCTVIGFPLGSTTPTVKAIEARDAIANGAEEIDMVINVGALKSGNNALVLDDIKAVREATRGKILKVIIETAYLTREEKIQACRLSKEAGADFVKTSTGFGPGGATAEDVALMRETVGQSMGVKASGGIRDTATAEAMIKAGATRIGASASVGIVTGKKEEKKGY